MERCLVTGAAGFIGSHLAEQLVEIGHHVVGVDSFTDFYPRETKERNLGDLRNHPHFSFVEGDLLDLDLAELFHGVDWVFHLAAQAGVRNCWGKAFEVYTRNNVLATQRLLEGARTANLGKFVFASSSSVYGDAEALPSPEALTPRPNSPYGVTKLACEHLCSLYWRNYGVPAVSLRYFTVYGPRQRPDMAFHKFILAALEDREIVVYGDGEQTREFTFVSDIVDGTISAARRGRAGDVFNLGGGSRASVNQVIRDLERILRKPVRVRYAEVQAGDVRHTGADTTSAAKMLGYAPRVDLSSGLRLELSWLQNEGHQ